MEHPENSDAYKGLTVNKGIEQPSIVNPYLKLRKKPKRRQFSVGEYVEGIVKGDVTVLSQAVTLVESVKPEHQTIAQEVIEKCLPYSGNSVRIGISGVPGAGKSTSIDVFGLHVLEKKGGKLAVLAIDPSSERSKGSILGDKTRMEKLSVHPKSFIRPSPSAGSLGGVARKTRETIILCEAAGFDKIFVETVGVGQSETAVHSMVDFFLPVRATNCKVSSAVLWKWPTASSSTRLTEIISRKPSWPQLISATLFICFRLRNRDGLRRYLLIPASTESELKKSGTWCSAILISSRPTAISNIAGTNSPNTGCMKPSMNISATVSITIPT